MAAMVATTAALLSAAWRRLLLSRSSATTTITCRRRLSRSSSASTILCREVSGRHRLTIDGCAPSTKLPRDWSATSRAFEAAGYTWQITYAPYGSGNSWRDKYISLQLVYGGHQRTDPLRFSFSLVHPATGDPVPAYTRAAEVCWFNGESVRKHGFPDFIRWEDLHYSGCLSDDGRFVVQCDITVIKDWAFSADDAVSNNGVADADAPAVPPSDLHEHIGSLLSKKHGADVAITVAAGGGEAATYDAHASLLAARSPVFEAELLAMSKDKSSVGGGGGGSVRRRRMEIHGVEPKVFEAMLHFVYTDALPEMAERDVAAMAPGLLAAAHRYELERLKLMCEEMLCKRIDVTTVASTLVVAERHGCRALKDACLEFMAVPGNLKRVMDTEGYQKIKADCPAVLLEFAIERMPV